jgi:hypothetical protein
VFAFGAAVFAFGAVFPLNAPAPFGRASTAFLAAGFFADAFFGVAFFAAAAFFGVVVVFFAAAAFFGAAAAFFGVVVAAFLTGAFFAAAGFLAAAAGFLTPAPVLAGGVFFFGVVAFFFPFLAAGWVVVVVSSIKRSIGFVSRGFLPEAAVLTVWPGTFFFGVLTGLAGDLWPECAPPPEDLGLSLLWEEDLVGEETRAASPPPEPESRDGVFSRAGVVPRD